MSRASPNHDTHLHAVPHDSGAHGSLRSYAVGLLLSLALTLAAFGAIMAGTFSSRVALSLIVGLCVAQLLVQLVFFLHMGTGPSQRSNTGIFLSTGFLIVVVVAGSLWVMHNANLNMMPTHMSPERAKMRE
jgi:cytochrome o ubiquinol oxidase operon protein cyoD